LTLVSRRRWNADSTVHLFIQVIVTSYLFPSAKFSLVRLEALERQIGKDKLVVDVR
jgi:hypothetical protein